MIWIRSSRLSERVSTEEFDATAKELEAFIGHHGRVRVLEILHDFEGMDAKAFWQDSPTSEPVSRCAIISQAKFLSLWSAIAEPFIDCEVAYFPPDEVEAARDWLLWPEGAADVIESPENSGGSCAYVVSRRDAPRIFVDRP